MGPERNTFCEKCITGNLLINPGLLCPMSGFAIPYVEILRRFNRGVSIDGQLGEYERFV